MYIPELLYLYLYSEVVWAGVRPELSFCPGHVVVGQPHYVLMVRVRGPHRQIEVQFALRVTFGWALEAIFLDCQDISPSIVEKILTSLKLLLLLF